MNNVNVLQYAHKYYNSYHWSILDKIRNYSRLFAIEFEID